MTAIGSASFPYISLFDAYTASTTVPQVPTLIDTVTLSPNRSGISYNTLTAFASLMPATTVCSTSCVRSTRRRTR